MVNLNKPSGYTFSGAHEDHAGSGCIAGISSDLHLTHPFLDRRMTGFVHHCPGGHLRWSSISRKTRTVSSFGDNFLRKLGYVIVDSSSEDMLPSSFLRLLGSGDGLYSCRHSARRYADDFSSVATSHGCSASRQEDTLGSNGCIPLFAVEMPQEDLTLPPESC